MNELVLQSGSEVAKFNPAESAARVHVSEAMERAALRAKDVRAVEAAVLAKLEAQREFAAGYRAQIDPRGGRPNLLRAEQVKAEEYCSRFGFAWSTVRRWADRLLDDAGFQAEFHERQAKVWRILQMEQAANYSSESVEWYTPSRYVEAARECMGGIDLDPASSAKANETVKATKFLTDGLGVEWKGRVFLNPPYGVGKDGKSVASEFCKKAIREYLSGHVTHAIVLVNSVHSQKWQAPLYEFPVCFVDHRIQFISSDGEMNENPTFQNIFVYMGPHYGPFEETFSEFGYVMMKPFRQPGLHVNE